MMYNNTMMQQLITDTAQYFNESFNGEPDHIFLSPGRINLIGEHIDYNDGFVLPAAIDKYVSIAISVSGSDKCTIAAKDMEETFEFDLKDEIVPVTQCWANYFLGILKLIKNREKIKGFQLAFSSTIPIGAGLSSSAAIECGFAFALNEIFALDNSKKEIALIGQLSENTFVGVQCGIMDQFASVFGKAENVIMLDCRDLSYEYHHADLGAYSLLLLNSNVKHSLLTSGYNDRRTETALGFTIIRKTFPEIKSFRDCTEEQVAQLRSEMGETIWKRCNYTVKEIRRVTEAAAALDTGNLKLLGKLMFETHAGLSEEFEVSCAETDFLVNAVHRDPKVLGARMMGGGFGGCTINLIEKGYEDELIARVSSEYNAAFNHVPEPYKIIISDGTHAFIQAS